MISEYVLTRFSIGKTQIISNYSRTYYKNQQATNYRKNLMNNGGAYWLQKYKLIKICGHVSFRMLKKSIFATSIIIVPIYFILIYYVEIQSI
jgi:hypothetical protein